MKKLVAMVVMAIVLTGVATFATEVTTPGAGGTSIVPLTVEVTTFSVTVPMSLPVTVGATGEVITATDAKIVNNSFGMVKVTNVTITGVDGWSIISFDEDMALIPVNSKKIAFLLNGDKTTASGLEFKDESYGVMGGKTSTTAGGEIDLTYSAKVPAQSVAIAGTTVANVVFTLAWNN